MNTTDFLMIASAIVPDRVAMHFDGQEITFANFQERVNRLANGIADRGVGAGDRVGELLTLLKDGEAVAGFGARNFAEIEVNLPAFDLDDIALLGLRGGG